MKTTPDCESALNAKAQRREYPTKGAGKFFRFSAALLIGLILRAPEAHGELLPIPLDYQLIGNHLVLSWTNAAFSLQVAPSSHAGFTNLPGATSPYTNVLSSAQRYFRLLGTSVPAGMVLIPAGSFIRGDTFNEGNSDERPTNTVYVSAFYMDKYEVTKALWDEVRNWNGGNGYSYDYADSGQGKAANHPGHSMTWYDVVKWSNARSQKEGLTPCYYTDAGLTVVYKTGQVAPYVKWNANGYRLPTEAEWEKAARGGVSGRRFPWSDTDNITHSRANYYSSTSYGYDTSSTRGYHPTFSTGGSPYTSPVDYFAPNGYGLYDMAGNVWEWCWDWYSGTYYSSSPTSDPRGPASGSYRVGRGGSWDYVAIYCRTAGRGSLMPADRYNLMGFRSVRAAGQ